MKLIKEANTQLYKGDMKKYVVKESLNESTELDRQAFVSLVKLGDKSYDGYSILNDGNFVKRLYADSDEDAISQFRDWIGRGGTRLKESVNLTESTSNFWSQEDLPLYAFLTFDEAADRVMRMVHNDPEYAEGDDDKYYELEDKYYTELENDGYAVIDLDDGDLYSAINEVNDLIAHLAGMAYGESYKLDRELENNEYSDEEYGRIREEANEWYDASDYLDGLKLGIKPGYYEGAQLYLEGWDKYFIEAVPEDYRQQIVDAYNKIGKDFGLMKLGVAYHASNGETGYNLIKESTTLTERAWRYTLRNGAKLRNAIDLEDGEGIRTALLACYKELLDNEFIDEYDYDDWTEEIRDADWEDEYGDLDDDAIDFELDQLYDLCDNIDVFVALDDDDEDISWNFKESLKEGIDSVSNMIAKQWAIDDASAKKSKMSFEQFEKAGVSSNIDKNYLKSAYEIYINEFDRFEKEIVPIINDALKNYVTYDGFGRLIARYFDDRRWSLQLDLSRDLRDKRVAGDYDGVRVNGNYDEFGKYTDGLTEYNGYHTFNDAYSLFKKFNLLDGERLELECYTGQHTETCCSKPRPESYKNTKSLALGLNAEVDIESLPGVPQSLVDKYESEDIMIYIDHHNKTWGIELSDYTSPKDITRDERLYIKRTLGSMLPGYKYDRSFSGISLPSEKTANESLKEATTPEQRARRRGKLTTPYDTTYTLSLKNRYNYTVIQYRVDTKNKTIEKGLFNWGDGKGSFFNNSKELQRHIGDLLAQGYKMIESKDETLKEDWYVFEYESGANPYIAKSEKERDRILRKYRDRVKDEGDNTYFVYDREEDLFSVDESFDDYVFDILVDDDYIDVSDYNGGIDFIDDLKTAREVRDRVKMDYPDSKVEISKHSWDEDNHYKDEIVEDTVKQGNSWVNKGKEGTHGKFKTKKEADAQRKAMFANSGKNRNFGESLKEDTKNERVVAYLKDVCKLTQAVVDGEKVYKLYDGNNNLIKSSKNYRDMYREYVEITIPQRPKGVHLEISSNLESLKESKEDIDVDAWVLDKIAYMNAPLATVAYGFDSSGWEDDMETRLVGGDTKPLELVVAKWDDPDHPNRIIKLKSYPIKNGMTLGELEAQLKGDKEPIKESIEEPKQEEPVEEKKETAKDRVLAKRAMKEVACKEPDNKPEGNWAWDKDACDWYDKGTDTFHSETIKEEVVEESIDPETYVEDMEGFEDFKEELEESLENVPIITNIFANYNID